MLFIKRITAPSKTNKYYIKAGKGGYNKAEEINKTTHLCLPNCCGLVHGRWLESQKQTEFNKYDKLCLGDAQSYYGHKDEYKRGKTPKLGSIICYSKKGSYGHVAFVEEIKSNGDIIISNSAYKGNEFFLKTLKKSNNYKYSNVYEFQGFIYPPVEFTPQFNLKRILKVGIKGDDVLKLQKELNKRGYKGKDGKKLKEDKIFGVNVEYAVKCFQKDKKLKSDGIVGKDTAHKLEWLYNNK